MVAALELKNALAISTFAAASQDWFDSFSAPAFLNTKRRPNVKLVFWVYLRVLAVVVYVQYIGSQFYDPTSEGLAESVYRIIDPLMVLAMLIAVYYAYKRKRVVDTGPESVVTREYLEANGTFYISIALLVGLLWNWVGFQFANPATTHSWLWAVIDITAPILFFATSTQLMKNEE